MTNPEQNDGSFPLTDGNIGKSSHETEKMTHPTREPTEVKTVSLHVSDIHAMEI